MPCIWNSTQFQNYNMVVHKMEPALDTWHLLCAPFSISFNLLVLYIAFRHIDLRGRLSQWFVVSMTIADLFYGVIYMSTKSVVHCFPRQFCAFYYICVWISQIISVLSLLLLNVDKFISIRYPLRYHSLVTQITVGIQTVGGWILTISYCIVSYLIFTSYYENPLTECRLIVNILYYSVTILLFYILPTTVSLLISIYIYWKAQKQSRFDASIVEAAARAFATHAHTLGMQRRRIKKKLLKRVFFVFSSTLWTSVTFLPYRIAYSVYMLTIILCGSRCVPDNMMNTIFYLWFLLPLGAVGNPIITIVTQRQYRKALRRLIFPLLRLFQPFRTQEEPIYDFTYTTSVATENMELTPLNAQKHSQSTLLRRTSPNMPSMN